MARDESERANSSSGFLFDGCLSIWMDESEVEHLSVFKISELEGKKLFVVIG